MSCRAISDAWLAALSLPVPSDVYRKVLLRLHSRVIPHMHTPVLLADFLTHSLNQVRGQRLTTCSGAKTSWLAAGTGYSACLPALRPPTTCTTKRVQC